MDGLDRPTVFRVGSPTLGVPTMALDYRGAGAPLPLPAPAPVEPPEAGRLTRLELKVALLDATVASLRQALLDIEFPPSPPPWYARLAAWLRAQWQARLRR